MITPHALDKKIRVFGYLLVRLGRFLQSPALMVMRSDDLVEFSRRFYVKPARIAGWSAHDLVDPGLPPDEKTL